MSKDSEKKYKNKKNNRTKESKITKANEKKEFKEKEVELENIKETEDENYDEELEIEEELDEDDEYNYDDYEDEDDSDDDEDEDDSDDDEDEDDSDDDEDEDDSNDDEDEDDSDDDEDEDDSDDDEDEDEDDSDDDEDEDDSDDDEDEDDSDDDEDEDDSDDDEDEDDSDDDEDEDDSDGDEDEDDSNDDEDEDDSNGDEDEDDSNDDEDEDDSNGDEDEDDSNDDEDEDDSDDDEDENDSDDDEDENDSDDDEDENDSDDDEDDLEVELINNKNSKEKDKKIVAKPINKEKIQKIEKIAKEKKKNKNNNSRLNDFITFINKNIYIIGGFIGGALFAALIAFLIWPDRIATLKDGTQPVVKVDKKTYTANDLYEDMKDHYSVNLLLDQIDNDILTKMYEEDETMLDKVKSDAQNYINTYKQYYGYTEEEFLSKNGFNNYNAFLDYLKLDYRRSKYLDEYVKKNITDKEIETYYTNNVFGDINTQHVLVEVSTNDNDKKLKDADAKKLAEEIIAKINDGTKWEDIKKEYKDKVTFEDLKYQSWDASLESSFMKALKNMKDNSFSEEPVKTSYGYHIIYRLDQKEKPTLKDSKEKIIENLIAEKKASDTNLQNKALISLRDEKEINFSDSVMKSKYETYCKKYK